jgi:exosortase
MEQGVSSVNGAVANPPTGGLAGNAFVGSLLRIDRIPAVLTAVFFIGLFGPVFVSLAKDWWESPEAGHGLLLAPVSVWLAWKAGIRAGAKPNHVLGFVVLVFAVLVRCAAGLAAELFTMRASIVMALGGLTIYHYGFRQLLHWWLPFTLASLAIPLPEIVTQALALPLQFRASKMGAALLQMRDIPVRLTGNVIRLPGHELFVTEACSGLRSLTALISVAVLMSAMFLRTAGGRVLLVLMAIPIAIVINGIRVFMTGFLVFFVSPELGKGFMHVTEGWLLFLVSMAALALFASLTVWSERGIMKWKNREATADV